MALSRTSRCSTALRFVAGAAMSVVALTGCNALGGETTIEAAAAPAVASAPAATTAPVVVPPLPPTAVPVVAAPVTATTTDDSAVGDDTTTEATTDDVVVVEEVVVVEDTDETTTDEATETASFNVTGSDCMDGRWISRAGEVARYMQVVGEDTGVAMQSSGYIIIVLENGHYTYDAQISTNIDIDGVAATSVIDGVTTGNFRYVTDDGNPYIEAEQQAGEISGYVDVLGTRIDASELGTEFNQAANFHRVQYDCGADPTFWFQTLPGFPRHDVHFQAWDGTRP